MTYIARFTLPVKIPIFDYGNFAKFLFPAVLLTGVFIYFFIRKIVLSLWYWTHHTKVHGKVKELRQVPQKKAAPTIVRKTDLFAQLNREQKKIYVLAKTLYEQHRFIEAAQLFESIHFQRKAIDILEKNGYIDEACAILIRMKLPYRAAVIYERNRQFFKASECYLQEGKFDMAAQNFEKLAETNFQFFRQAGDYYIQAGLIDSGLAAYSRLALSDLILQICVEKNKFDFLQKYLDLPFHAQELLPKCTPGHIQSLINSMPSTPQTALSLAHWTLYRPDEYIIFSALQKIGTTKELAYFYWLHLDANFCEFMGQLLANAKGNIQIKLLEVHHAALSALERPQLSEQIRQMISSAS